MSTALQYFGNTESVYEIISGRIHDARVSSGLVPEELGELASMSNPLQVAQLEKRTVKPGTFSVADILAISTQLGLTVERLLPFQREPSEEEKKSWEAERQTIHAGPLYPADGQSSLDPEKTIRLFLRFKALEELFTRRPDSAVPARA